MKKDMERAPAATRIISVSGLTVFVLGSMLWKIIRAYIQGGADAPTIGILIAAIVVLGGGIAFALWLIFSKGKGFMPPATQEQSSSDNN